MANAFQHLIPDNSQNAFSHLIPKEERGVGEELGRQLGLTGRAIAGGLSQAVQPLTEPVRYLLDKAGVPGQKYSTEQNIDALLTKAGVPEPETDTERGVQTAGRFVTSLAGGVGETAIANKIAGVKPKLPDMPAPTTQQLTDKANAAYKAAEDAGVTYSPESVQRLSHMMETHLAAEGFHPKVHKEAARALKAIRDFAKGPQSLGDIDSLRQVAGDVGASSKAKERRMSKMMTSIIDDFVSNARPSDVVAGNPREAAAHLGKARDYWARKSKAEVIEELFSVADINKSTYSQSGFENALRTKIKQLARNSKAMRKFTTEEQKAIKRAAMGGPIDNFFQKVGKMAPRGVISGILAPSAVYSTLGPEAAVAMTMAGEGARRYATKATMRNIDDAYDLILRGGAKPKQAGPNPLPPWLLPSVIGLDENAY